VPVKKTAVVLMNLGGPEDLSSVRPFLFNLFYDRAILRVPNPLRWMLAKVISLRREKEARKIYKKLGGRSPLLEETEAQARALELDLNKSNKGGVFRVFISMRYWHPFSKEVVEKISHYNPEQIILLPLYPQFSTTTSESSIKDFKKELESKKPSALIKTIPCFFHLDGFLRATENSIRPFFGEALKKGRPRILWTAHGLPKKIVEQGDPYQKQVEETVRLVEEKLKDLDFDSIVCYQSRVGPLEWIGPYTEDEIKRAGKEGASLIVVPISFVSEHSETLVELDMEYKKIAIDVGVPFYGRASTVRIDPFFIKGVSSLITGVADHQTTCLNKKADFCCLNLPTFCK
jgi:ferrochelatase